MASAYRYRVIRSSWGIAIDITAEAAASAAGAQPVADNLYLRVEVSANLSAEEHAYLVRGLRLVAKNLQAMSAPDVPIVVRVLAIEFSESDYQPEGLACAMAGWAAQEYGFEPPVIQVTFDRQANHYHFSFFASHPKELP